MIIKDEDWALPVDSFLKSGGFSSAEAMDKARSRILEMVKDDDLADFILEGSWGERISALSLCAALCLKCSSPSSDLEPLAHAITAAYGCSSVGWVEGILFELVHFKFFGVEPDDVDRVSSNLFQCIKDAASVFERAEQRTNAFFYRDAFVEDMAPDSVLSMDRLGLLTKPDYLRASLEELGEFDVTEAYLLISFLHIGDEKYRRLHLEKAVRKGRSPSRQLAAFVLGESLKSTNPGKADAFFKKVNFPTENFEDDGLLIGLAIKARKNITRASTKAFYGSVETLLPGGRVDNEFGKWSSASSRVADQWVTVERCEIRVLDIVGYESDREHADQISLSEITFNSGVSIDVYEAVSSLAIEMGKLIEAFFKDTLEKHPINTDSLHNRDRVCDWDLDYFDRYVGNVFVFQGSQDKANFCRILTDAGVNITSLPRELAKLTGHDNQRNVWSVKVGMMPLLFANGMSCARDMSHPFRKISGESLAEAIGNLCAAYNIRNAHAHYSAETERLPFCGPGETLFWSKVVRALVNRFMGGKSEEPQGDEVS